MNETGVVVWEWADVPMDYRLVCDEPGKAHYGVFVVLVPPGIVWDDKNKIRRLMFNWQSLHGLESCDTEKKYDLRGGYTLYLLY
jgi:hypothetical protein